MLIFIQDRLAFRFSNYSVFIACGRGTSVFKLLS